MPIKHVQCNLIHLICSVHILDTKAVHRGEHVWVRLQLSCEWAWFQHLQQTRH